MLPRLLPLLLLASLTGCARAFFHAGAAIPYARPAPGVQVSWRGTTLLVRPEHGPAQPLVFLHGFASRPEHQLNTLKELAARGFAIEAPTLPDFYLFRCGYHEAVRSAALEAYDVAAAEANKRGEPAPVVAGFSMGGGAALAVAAQRGVPAVLWAPARLDGPLARPTQPLLIIWGDKDCIVKGKPRKLHAELAGASREVRIPGGNHVGFLDVAGADGLDCAPGLPRAEQLQRAVQLTADFLAAPQPPPGG